MYNQALKLRFLDEAVTKDSVRTAYTVAFHVCEPFEEAWNADLCTRSAEELQPMVDKLSGVREHGRKNRLYMMQDYVKWRINTGVPGACDGMMHVDVTGIGKMQTHSVRSPLHLQTYLDAIFEKESELTVDNTYRCYYWLAYSGMKSEDIPLVKTSDVDFSELVVRLGDEEFPIYREAIPAMKNCVRQREFLFKHPAYETWLERVPGDQLLRGIRCQISPGQMRVVLCRAVKAAGADEKLHLQLSYFRIWLSGVFYRMYERELVGIPPDFTDVARKMMDGKTYSLKTAHTTEASYLRKLKKQYLTDYQNWKQTLRL